MRRLTASIGLMTILAMGSAPVAHAGTFNEGIITDPKRAIYVRKSPEPYCNYRLYNCAQSVDSQ